MTMSERIRADLAAILISLLVAGCNDEIVSREYGEPITERKQNACRYSRAGVCQDCGIGFDGKLSCTMKFKPICWYTGTQDALLETTPMTVHYKSGKIWKTEKSVVLKTYSECN